MFDSISSEYYGFSVERVDVGDTIQKREELQIQPAGSISCVRLCHVGWSYLHGPWSKMLIANYSKSTL